MSNQLTVTLTIERQFEEMPELLEFVDHVSALIDELETHGVRVESTVAVNGLAVSLEAWRQ